MADSHVPKLVVGGAKGVGKKSIVAGMFQCDSERTNDKWSQVNNAETNIYREEIYEEQPFSVYPWRISTKYYDADVEVWRCAHSEELKPSVDSSADLMAVEALILVFDQTRPETFAALSRWSDFVHHYSPAVRLCVGTRAEIFAEQGQGERLRRYLEWCLDHGFELIQADGNNWEYGTEGREKYGVARIVQALQANMWSSLVMKDRSSFSTYANVADAAGNAPEAICSASASGEFDLGREDKANFSRGRAVEVANTQSDEARHSGVGGGDESGHHGHQQQRQREEQQEEEAKQSLERQQQQQQQQERAGVEEREGDQLRTDDILRGLLPSEETGKITKEEQEMEDLEKVFEQVRFVSDNASRLPMAERREKAAAMAMKLWAMMGLDEDSDGESAEKDPDAEIEHTKVQ